MTETVKAPEGWGVIRPGDRKAHYYRDGYSLCGRPGFYGGTLYRDGSYVSADTHAGCRKALGSVRAGEDS